MVLSLAWDALRRLSPPHIVAMITALGVLIYAGVGVASMMLGGSFLDYNALDAADPAHGQHIGIILVEFGVGVTVTSVMLTLFFAFAGFGDPKPHRKEASIMSLGLIATHWNYLVVIALMLIGLYIVMSRKNFVKKLIGLAIFQTSLFLLYISLGRVEGGTAPIIDASKDYVYSNPLPHVLILTAIVVGVATTALGLALVLRIHQAFGTIEEDEILAAKTSDYNRDGGAL